MNRLKLWTVAAFSADIFTTGVALGLGAVEANPVMQSWSYGEIALAKGVVLIALLGLQRRSRMALTVLTYAGGATSAVVTWNIWQFIRYFAAVGV